jgi:membrane protease YdiL (CAAX protease family)
MPNSSQPAGATTSNTTPRTQQKRGGPPVWLVAGTPYHQLGRTTRWRWWAALAVVVLAYPAVQAVLDLYSAVAVRLPAGGQPVTGPHTDLAALLAAVGLLVPMVLLAVRWIEGRPAGTVCSVLGRMRWSWLGVCLAGCLAVLALYQLAERVLSAGWAGAFTDCVGWGGFAATGAVMAVVGAASATGEEFLFRGLVLQAVGGLFPRPVGGPSSNPLVRAVGRLLCSPWPAIVVQAALFMAVHGVGSVPGMTDVFVIGMLLGWLTVRTGGLEAAIGFHAANEIVTCLVDVAFWRKADGPVPTDATVADLPWADAIQYLILVGIIIAVVAWEASLDGTAVVVPPAPDSQPNATPTNPTAEAS